MGYASGINAGGMTPISEAARTAQSLVQMIERAIIGRREAVELATCAFLAGGHLLIEDVPGVGKTTLARALAKAFGGEFRRIQFTSDLLPADIIGVAVWNQKSNDFHFKPGPIFGNIVLADEINRSTPKTQSALLEAMSEGKVSVDGISMDLPQPFAVIATQNEQEHHGTYPLPESQLDRFLMCISIGYPERLAEERIVARRTQIDPAQDVQAIISPSDIESLSQAVDDVKMDDTVLDHLMAIIGSTRRSELLLLGVGPRGGMALHRAARARALLRNRDYCLIDDLRELARPVLAHRVIPKGAYLDGRSGRQFARSAIEEIVRSVEIPL